MILFCIQGVLHAAEQKITYGIKPGQDYVYYDVTNGAGDDYILKLTVSGSWAEVDMSGSMEWSGSAGDYPTNISDCPDSSDPSYETFSFTGSTDPLTSASMHGDGWFGHVSKCGGTAGGSPPTWDLDIGDDREFGVRVPSETAETGGTSALVGERINLQSYKFYIGEEASGVGVEGDWNDPPSNANLFAADSGGTALSGTGLDNLIDVYAEASVADEYTFGAKLHTDSEKTGQETLNFHTLNLNIEGVADDEEVDPGGYIAVGTNNLQRINVVLEKSRLARDITLKVIEGVGVVKIWENSNGTQPVIPDTMSERKWLGSTAVPSAMYVELLSTTTESAVNLELSYAGHGGNTNGVDRVRFNSILAYILMPQGSIDASQNDLASWLVAQEHFDFQGLKAGVPGAYALDIEGIIAPIPPTSYKWTLEAAAGTLTNDTSATPIHTAPAAEGEGKLTLKAMVGTTDIDCKYERKVKIYRDCLERDKTNFGTCISCKDQWSFTRFNVAVQMNDTWNCHGGVLHLYSGSWNGYTSEINFTSTWAVIKNVNVTHVDGGGGSHPSLGELKRGDIVAYYTSNGVLMHSQMCTGNGTETYGANNEPMSYPGTPYVNESWKWATSPAGDWANNLWQPSFAPPYNNMPNVMPVNIKVLRR